MGQLCSCTRSSPHRNESIESPRSSVTSQSEQIENEEEQQEDIDEQGKQHYIYATNCDHIQTSNIFLHIS
jgi:hypothetical protein